ncbi:hypothetical protein [Sutterella wadsworthensis]|uniref:hypothetical protein n=1 Tax=Sutterella wadsworthensis TaxID=40545 RepID=UPI0013F69C02|nr:hypothetical protein [Sutterella wadsworthensis]
MHITQEMRQQACEGLLHFTPKKALARELGVSVGSIRDWAIYIQHGFFDWVDNLKWYGFFGHIQSPNHAHDKLMPAAYRILFYDPLADDLTRALDM